MSFTPMTDVPNPLFDLNGDPFSGAVLKAYLPGGGTTQISIYTDSSGSSPQATLTANAQGAWEVTGSEVVPYIDQDHKWGIFANASDADANTPFYMGPFDNVTAGVPLTSPNLAIIFDNVADLVSGTLPDGNTIVLAIGQTVKTLGYATEGDGGDSTYEIVAASTGTDDGGSFIDLNVLQAKGLFPGGFHSSAQWGVAADNDGTTGNGTDDTAAWLASIAYAKANNVLLTSPDGNTRITATLDMTLLVANFKCQFIKDVDGVGITFIEGGSVFTDIEGLSILAVGTQSATAHNITVIDSRMKLRRCSTNGAGGDGYRHTDDDGNNNHCELDILSNNNSGWNINILKGAQGDDSNNWTVNWQTFAGGGGVNIESAVYLFFGKKIAAGTLPNIHHKL